MPRRGPPGGDGRGTAYGLASNLFLVPLYSFFIVPASFFGAVLIPISGFLSDAVFHLAAYWVNAGYHGTRLVASLPGAYLRVGTPSPAELLAFYGLFAGVFFWKRGWGPRAAAGACLVVLVGFGPLYRLADRLDGDLRFTVIDVGQGQSQLMEIPGGYKILVDGGPWHGPFFDAGERVLAPFFWKKRIRHFDLLVSSHPDSDHFGGLKFIVDNFRVGRVWISGHRPKSTEVLYPEFLSDLDKRGVPTRIVHAGSKPAHFGEARLAVLWPPKGLFQDEDLGDNNTSLVLKLVFGRTSFLMPADIEATAEELLLASDVLLSADVLVAPHHGSKSSSSPAFVEAVRPSFALISSGRYNRFGHPAASVLGRYSLVGTRVFRTDRQGRILCRSDGKNVNCLPFWKEKAGAWD